MDIQRLRCKANFQALIFVPHIRQLGDTLVNRLRSPSTTYRALGREELWETTGAFDKPEPWKFVVLHLRFDKVLLEYTSLTAE